MIYIIKNWYILKKCGKYEGFIRELEIYWIFKRLVRVGFRRMKGILVKGNNMKDKNVGFFWFIRGLRRCVRIKFVRISLGYSLGLSFIDVVLLN